MRLWLRTELSGLFFGFLLGCVCLSIIVSHFQKKTKTKSSSSDKEEEEEPDREMQRPKQLLLQSTISFFFFFNVVSGQLSIPAKFDGFVYKNNPANLDSIVIEAFFDPVCPDSRDAWPPLKRAFDYYYPRVSLIVHPFALPYHDNAFVTSRALHIVNKLNSSATYNLMESFFKHQEKFYNQQTRNMSRASIVNHLVKFVTKTVGNSLYSAVEAGFNDRQTDLTTRVSFKYGCSRGVLGTPYFFVNGFPLPDSGSAVDYNEWRSLIDPLIKARGGQKEESLRYFL